LKRNTALLLIVVIAIVGFWISGYLTWLALIVPAGTCPIYLGGWISCSAVLSSPYARIDGIPTSFLGLVWFIVAFLLALVSLRNGSWVRYLVYWGGVGVAGVIVLVAVEIFLVGEICLLCTSAHMAGLAIFGITVKLWQAPVAD